MRASPEEAGLYLVEPALDDEVIAASLEAGRATAAWVAPAGNPARLVSVFGAGEMGEVLRSHHAQTEPDPLEGELLETFSVTLDRCGSPHELTVTVFSRQAGGLPNGDLEAAGGEVDEAAFLKEAVVSADSPTCWQSPRLPITLSYAAGVEPER